MATLRDLARAFDAHAPESLAESWDNVGLQLGDPAKIVRRVLTCLEVDPEVVKEAVDLKADAIVAHHPVLFKPPKSIRAGTYQGDVVRALCKHDIGLIVAHTNLDKVAWGTNRVMAHRLGLMNTRLLHPEPASHLRKLVVFVPDGSEAAMIDALDAAGAGHIGRYKRCTFRTQGIGGFQGDETTHPTIGTAGKYEETGEWRLETVAPSDKMPAIVAAMLKAHPYEEVAYDVYILDRRPDPIHGYGLLGDLPDREPVTLDMIARRASMAFSTEFCLVVGDGAKIVHRVAVSSGSGGHSVQVLAGDACDVLITGEMTYHVATEARHKGLAVVCVGHFASEAFVAQALATFIVGEFIGVDALVSHRCADPFHVPTMNVAKPHSKDVSWGGA